MFQEQIAKITADHLRSHIEAYLGEINEETTGTDKIILSIPTVDTDSMAGGLLTTDIDKIPKYAVDCINKSLLSNDESLWLYQYEGAIAGLVAAESVQSVDKLVKRHGRAVEHFLKEHQFLHSSVGGEDNFFIRELSYSSTTLSGAMEVEDGDNPIWVAGFSVDAFWAVSEDGPRQHP